MRHFLLALLIALLPIRGWVGGAMAVAMVSQGAAAHAATGLPQEATVPDALECFEHSAALHAAVHAVEPSPIGTDAASPHTTQHGAHGDTMSTHGPGSAHAACELCNGPALALGWSPTPLPPPSHGPVVASDARFDSTVLPQGIKPPIS